MVAGLALAAWLAPGLALAAQVPVTAVSGWPGTMASDEPAANAIDGSTDTYMTFRAGQETAPVQVAIAFERTAVNRIRLWKQARGARPRNIAIQYTTGTGPLERRAWTNVSRLATGYNGEFIHSTSVNADGTVEDDDHDSPPMPDGAGHLWASLTFDTVIATGLRIVFAEAGPARASCEVTDAGHACSELRIAELQAHYEAPPDRTAPATIAMQSPLPNPAGWSNANVVVSLHATDEAGGSGVHHVTYSTAGAQPTPATSVAGADASISITAEGTTTVSWFATDNAGNEEAMQSLTVKLDKTDPTVLGLPAHCVLWPADGSMVTVANVSASDALSGPGSFTVSATTNERPRAGHKDILLRGAPPAPTTVRLRAESRGRATGRVYTLTVVANDVAGNTTVAMTTCIVPRDVDD